MGNPAFNREELLGYTLILYCFFFFFSDSGGLLVLTGAKAALEGTPGKCGLDAMDTPRILVILTCCTSGMVGYGLAKAGVHQLIKSLAEPKGGLHSNGCVLGILPYVQQICGRCGCQR